MPNLWGGQFFGGGSSSKPPQQFSSAQPTQYRAAQGQGAYSGGNYASPNGQQNPNFQTNQAPTNPYANIPYWQQQQNQVQGTNAGGGGVAGTQGWSGTPTALVGPSFTAQGAIGPMNEYAQFLAGQAGTKNAQMERGLTGQNLADAFSSNDTGGRYGMLQQEAGARLAAALRDPQFATQAAALQNQLLDQATNQAQTDYAKAKFGINSDATGQGAFLSPSRQMNQGWLSQGLQNQMAGFGTHRGEIANTLAQQLAGFGTQADLARIEQAGYGGLMTNNQLGLLQRQKNAEDAARDAEGWNTWNAANASYTGGGGATPPPGTGYKPPPQMYGRQY